MTQKIIDRVVDEFASEAKKVYGSKLERIILFGSCARGDFEADSDIDVMILLDVPHDRIPEERKKLKSLSNRLDWDYDVLLAPVFESKDVYHKFMDASGFFQNVEKEGVSVA